MKELVAVYCLFVFASFFRIFGQEVPSSHFGNWSLLLSSLWVSCLIKGLPNPNVNQLYEVRDRR